MPAAIRDWSGIQRHTAGRPLQLSIGTPALASEGDLFQAREILAQGAYCLRGFIPHPGWLVVDVGANIGLFTAWAARLMGRGRIIAVEAMPATYKVLVSNTCAGGACRSGRSRVEVVQIHAAVWRKASQLEFEYFPENSGVSRLASDAEDREKPVDVEPRALWRPESVSVRAQPLDALLAETAVFDADRSQVDLLKIDIEGMELACVEGATATLLHTQRVVFEYHSGSLRDSVADVLSAAGFRCRACKPGNVENTRGLHFWSRPRAAVSRERGETARG